MNIRTLFFTSVILLNTVSYCTELVDLAVKPTPCINCLEAINNNSLLTLDEKKECLDFLENMKKLHAHINKITAVTTNEDAVLTKTPIDVCLLTVDTPTEA